MMKDETETEVLQSFNMPFCGCLEARWYLTKLSSLPARVPPSAKEGKVCCQSLYKSSSEIPLSGVFKATDEHRWFAIPFTCIAAPVFLGGLPPKY